MTHCCSQCSFTAQFESALTMHHQLYHETANQLPGANKVKDFRDKFQLLPQVSSYPGKKEAKVLKIGRTSSATRLFEKLKTKICRSRLLFSHPEETSEQALNIHDLTASSDCTSKALKLDSSVSRPSGVTVCLREQPNETFGCHLCSFDADRITILDRHLRDIHNLSLEGLLKLVIAKTKVGLDEDLPKSYIFGIHQPYYKAVDEIIDTGEFFIQTVSPKTKILKHNSTNTEMQWSDIPNLKINCRILSKQLDELIKYPMDTCEKDQLFNKIQTLNDCMSRFVNSSNAMKRVFTKEYDSHSSRGKALASCDETNFELGLGDQETPRERLRAHSEKMTRSRNKRENKCRSSGVKTKVSSESFYF